MSTESVVRSGRYRDISGMRFGRLTAVCRIGFSEVYRVSVWRCRCDCGGEVSAYLTNLVSGATRSCGCLRTEQAERARRIYVSKHGKTESYE